MDFDVNVSKVQGILYSLGSQELLNKSGSVQNVVEEMKKVIHTLPSTTKSKITFLMVLNTRLAISEELKKDDFVCLFTNTSPYIEKEYLITYVYYLNLQEQLFKVIENCPGALSLELLDTIVKKLKEPAFHKDEFGTVHLYQLWESVFVKICKINARIHLNDSHNPFMTYFQEIYDLILNVLVTSMKVCGLECFVGYHLYNLFKSILHFLQHKNLNLEDDPVFLLSVQFQNSETDFLIDLVKVCNDLVFENILKVLENLTVDMWITFSECYFDFDSNNSVQFLIGDLVSCIIDEVKDFKLPSDILNCLSSLAIKKSDLMAKASVSEIISNLDNGEKEWFPALVSHNDFICENSLECLIKYLHLANSDDLNVILNKSYDYLCSCKDEKCVDLVKKLFLTAIKITSKPLNWLEKVFEKYQPDLLTTEEAHNEIIETFNKISKEKDIQDCDIISLCMQLPFETIKKICHMAVSGSQETDFIIDILKLLKHPCNASHGDGFTLLDCVLLKFILKDLTNTEKQPFINLVVQLGKVNLLKDSFFNNLLKTLKSFLENEILEMAVICLEIVKSLLNLKLFNIEEAAFLVFLSQVLGFFSWDLRSFSVVKAEGRDLGGFIADLVISRLNDVSGPEFQWVRKEILNSEEVVQAQFCDLWFSRGYIWSGSGKIHSCILALAHSRHKAENLRQFLISFDESFQVKASIVTGLSVVLPVTTFQEWKSIFGHLIIVSENLNSGKNAVVDNYCDVLDMFGTALFVIARMSEVDREVFICFQHCLRSFGLLVGIYCPKMKDESFLPTFKKIFFIISTFEDDNEKMCCWEICSPVLLELTDWMKKKMVVEEDKNAIKEMLPLLDLKEVADIIDKNLQ